MLESLLEPKKARNNLPALFFVSMLLAFASVIFSYYIFPDYSTVLSIAFITIVFTPFFQRLFASEEAIEEFAMKHHMDKSLFQRHAPVIKIYGAFFLGLLVIMSLLYVFLPQEMKLSVFDKQISEVERLSGMKITGSFLSFEDAKRIFFNNMMVLIVSFVASLLFGTGSIFILSWNASVIGVYAGSYANYLIAGGMLPLMAYAYGIPHALLSITLHGVPEILGYFFAGIAGGILSVGIIKEKFGSREMEIIIFDSLIFLGIGLFSIFIGSFIEVGDVAFSSIAFIAYAVFMATLFFHGNK